MTFGEKIKKQINWLVAEDENVFDNTDVEDVLDVQALADEALKIPVEERKAILVELYKNVAYGDFVVRGIIFEIRRRDEHAYDDTVRGTMIGEVH